QRPRAISHRPSSGKWAACRRCVTIGRGRPPMFEAPPLTPTRVRIVYATALVTDVLQLALGPLGFAFLDEILDVAAMIVTMRAVRFPPRLLATVVVEPVPVGDLVPAWTGCVALGVALRKREQAARPQPPSGPIIDV